MPPKFVIDTSLFVNPQAHKSFGATPSASVAAFIEMIDSLEVGFFMPASTFKELSHFIGDSSHDLEPYVKRRSPNLYSIYLPAGVMYDFIDDIRERINKGLKLAEEFANDNREDTSKIGKLREKYRGAMRTGLVDSKEDFELIMLAKELDATLVSADEGILSFADKIGIEWINAQKFHGVLKKLGKKKK